MWIKELYIGDFGCLQHQQLDELEPGLIVIGGPQRAGKTTFMRVLRNLGYGFRRGAGLPPPVSRYQVRANVVHEGQSYRIAVDGHAAPTTTSLHDDRVMETAELFGRLSHFSYHQLFTISLDELRRLPRGTDSIRELQTVLLGAGWADAVRVPELKRTFADEAQSLGGVHGKAYELTPHRERLEEALEDKRKALEQVDKYRQMRDELQQLADRLEADAQKRQELTLERRRLTTARDQFARFHEYSELRRELSTQHNRQLLSTYPSDGLSRAEALLTPLESALKSARQCRRSFQRRAGTDEPETRKAGLLKHREQLETCSRQLEAWRTRVKTLRASFDDLDQRFDRLRAQADQLHDGWKNSLTVLEQLRTDLVSGSELETAVEAHEQRTEELARNRQRQQEVQTELNEYREGLQRETAPGLQTLLPRAGGFAVLACALGLAAAFMIEGTVGLLIGLGGTALVAALTIPRLQGALQRDQLQRDLERAQDRLQALVDEEHQLESDLEEPLEQLAHCQEQLGLPTTVEPARVLDFYHEARRLKAELDELQAQQKRLEKDQRELEETLSDAGELVHAACLASSPDEHNLSQTCSIDDAETVFAEVERCLEELELALELDEAEVNLEELRQRATGLLAEEAGELPSGASPEELLRQLEVFIERGEEFSQLRQKQEKLERLKSALEGALSSRAVASAFAETASTPESSQDTLAALAQFMDGYASLEGIEADLEETERRLKRLADQLEADRERKVRLEDRLEELAAPDRLLEAQQELDSVRSELEPLVERYAVLRISEKLLDHLQERFVERTKEELMSAGSELFAELTGGDYSEVLPPLDLDSPDFRVVHESDKAEQSTQMLSRGTREQLFLAVRLARIRSVSPPLPVILDDSTANFDPAHLRRAVEAVAELAQTHQVFLLTCHPHVVELAAAAADNAQFWYLESGNFDGPLDDPCEPIKKLEYRAVDISSEPQVE